jgi:plastocyanin domain-containing protein
MSKKKKDPKPNENASNLRLLVGIVLVGFVFLALANAFLNSPPTPLAPSGPGSTVGAADAQIVNLTMANYNYSPSVITVKANQPVRIVADLSKVQGCYRAFNIPGLRIQKVFASNDNALEFTPTTPGTYPFSCAMGMGRGTLVVI